MPEAPKIPDADIVAEEGLSHIQGYVERLFASTKTAAVLMISTLEGEGSLTLLHMGGRTYFNLVAGWSSTSPQETHARQCLTDGLGVDVEEKEQNGTRILGFSMEGDVSRLTYASQQVMANVYGIGKKEGLKFRFDEWSL